MSELDVADDRTGAEARALRATIDKLRAELETERHTNLLLRQRASRDVEQLRWLRDALHTLARELSPSRRS
jgi:hypothetical protein